MSVSTAIHAYPISTAFERLVKAIKWYNKEQKAQAGDATAIR